MRLTEVRVQVPYQIRSIDLPEAGIRHLSELGLRVGTRVELTVRTKDSAIVRIDGNRLAFDAGILEAIDVSPETSAKETLPLSLLGVGETAYVHNIIATSQVKRHLMDMGLTKHTKLSLIKVAPLGDPIEISVRGYSLSLRKSEAQMISVIKVDKEVTS